MNIKQQLNMRLSQNLVMTQSLQQAIKLLQLSKLELVEFINQELEENPILEEETLDSSATDAEKNKREEEANTSEVDLEKPNIDEVDYDYFFEDYIEYQSRKVTREVYELPSFENTLAQQESLVDHLEWQMNLSMTNDQEMMIGELIIGNLDSDGYLKATLEEIAQTAGVTVEDVDDVRFMIQRLDPIGVASMGIQECLLVQLDNLNGKDVTLPRAIIADHLGLIERREYDALAKVLKCSMEDIHDSMMLIRTLDPKPGSKYAQKDSIYVEPDVFILREEDEYVIVLNEDNLPRLRLNRSYQNMLKKSSGQEQGTKDFIREKVNSAKWLMKSFVQRQRTIYKVVESIVERQRDFFDQGVEHLKPMILSDVALDIGMHESTVSRVVSNKYCHTPRGVFELKYFFSSGISSASGDNVSSLAVKERIKQIVEGEDTKKPYSDSKIMAILKNDGLNIARRTVAKYREELHIPPSKLRKSVF